MKINKDEALLLAKELHLLLTSYEMQGCSHDDLHSVAEKIDDFILGVSSSDEEVEEDEEESDDDDVDEDEDVVDDEDSDDESEDAEFDSPEYDTSMCFDSLLEAIPAHFQARVISAEFGDPDDVVRIRFGQEHDVPQVLVRNIDSGATTHHEFEYLLLEGDELALGDHDEMFGTTWNRVHLSKRSKEKLLKVLTDGEAVKVYAA